MTRYLRIPGLSFAPPSGLSGRAMPARGDMAMPERRDAAPPRPLIGRWLLESNSAVRLPGARRFSDFPWNRLPNSKLSSVEPNIYQLKIVSCGWADEENFRSWLSGRRVESTSETQFRPLGRMKKTFVWAVGAPERGTVSLRFPQRCDPVNSSRARRSAAASIPRAHARWSSPAAAPQRRLVM